jgi:autotransporter-associated beta strand protein
MLVSLSRVEAGALVRSAAGMNQAAIQAAIDQFRADLGGNNNGVGGSFLGGRREINWDGVPDASAAPANLPADFFNVNSPRGAVFVKVGAGASFQVSMDDNSPADPDPDQIEFNNINLNYSASFQTFSPKRLFTPRGNNVMDVTFRSPGTDFTATVRGFGVVFTDVDTLGLTRVEFFNESGASLGNFAVPSFNNGLSFLGVSFTAGERAVRVRITCGNSVVGPASPGPNEDVVVMDDFIYAEPRPTEPFLSRWDGGGANNLWSTQENWVTNLAPIGGVRLEFPGNAAQLANFNDFGAGTQYFHLLLGGSSYNLTGNSLTLNTGITATNNSGANVLDLPIRLGADQTFKLVGAGAGLYFMKVIDLDGHFLTIDGGGITYLEGGVVDDADNQPGVTGGLIKSGPGTLFINKNTTYSDGTVLNAGTLGSASNATVKISQLFTFGGTIVPGGGFGTGILSTDDLMLHPNTLLSMNLSGPNSGSGYDQLDVNGTVDLNGSKLVVIVGFVPSGQQFVIVNNDGSDPVSGIFDNITEATLLVTNGEPFKITYKGGTNNNDVVLRHIFPSVTVSDTADVEGNFVNFEIKLSEPTSKEVTVRVNTAGGTATANVDYNNIDSFFDVVFPAFTTTQTVSVPSFQDPDSEGDEMFTLNVLQVTNGSVADGSAVGNIIDDDTPRPTVSVSNTTAVEGSNAIFTFTLSFATPYPVTVRVNTTSGTATGDVDYNQINSSADVTFDPNETTASLAVGTFQDTTPEVAETFNVNILSTINAAIADGTGTATITNDDKATPTLSTTASPAIFLGGKITDTATLAAGLNPTGTVTFNLFGPNNATCGGAPVFTSTKPVNGNGNYPSASFTPTSTGVYRWVASYSGDANNKAIAGTCNAPNEAVTVKPGLVGNVATRLPVGTADNVLIEGFTVQGPANSIKKIIVRAIGPSLTPFGIPDALANPTLEIKNANNVTVATNNNWKTTQIGGLITSNQFAEINGSGLAPSNDLESAIIANLAPGSYTAVVAGVGNTTGTGVVDAYDLSPASTARLVNFATRGLIQPGDKLMIAGFIIQNGAVKAVVRAIGPSLTAFGIANALPDTTLQLRNQNGVIVRENDNWQSDPAQKQELESVGLQPSHNLEAALVATIPPGQYTAQVWGKGQASGIGVVQVYFLQ